MGAVESTNSVDPIRRVRRVGTQFHVTYRSGRPRTVLPVLVQGGYQSATAITCNNGVWETTAVNR